MPLSDHMQEHWNQLNEVPMSRWLAPHQTDSEQRRLHMLGNLVVPQQASLAFEILMGMVGKL